MFPQLELLLGSKRGWNRGTAVSPAPRDPKKSLTGWGGPPRGLLALPDIEVKYGAPLNYSLGERGSQDGVLLFCSVINSL